MIIFDLDGTLADYEHRRHFVIRPKQSKCTCDPEIYGFHGNQHCQMYDYVDWDPNCQPFYEACDEDLPIIPTIRALEYFGEALEYGSDTPWFSYKNMEIWSGRSESVRKKTEKWLAKHLRHYDEDESIIKMRPIGNTAPDEMLKELWLNEVLLAGKTIEFVFDVHPASIAMWRRRGIFVFNCCQNDKEF